MADSSASRSAVVVLAAKSLSHSAMLKVACLPPMKRRGTNATLMPERQRKQQQRPAFGIVGDHDEGREVLARSDLRVARG